MVLGRRWCFGLDDTFDFTCILTHFFNCDRAISLLSFVDNVAQQPRFHHQAELVVTLHKIRQDEKSKSTEVYIYVSRQSPQFGHRESVEEASNWSLGLN